MARSTRRTSVMLGGLAVVFVTIIIILCVVTKQQGYSDEQGGETEKSAHHPDVVPPTTTPETTSTTISSTTSTTPSPSPVTTGTTEASDPGVTSTTTPETTSTTISSTTSTTPSPSPATTGTTKESDSGVTNTTTPETTSTTISSTTTTSSSPTTTETNKESDPDATTITTLTSTASTTTSTITTLESDDDTSTSTTTPTSSSTTTLSTTTTTTGTQETTITEDDSATTTSTTSPTTTRPELKYKVCNSDACVSLAKDMNAMTDSNRDVNKCEDFYQFACGGVMKKPNIKPQQPGTIARMMIKDQLDLVPRNDNTTGQGKMRMFYDSCLNPGSQDAKKDWAKPIKDMFGTYNFTESALDIPSNFTFDKSAALGYMMRKGFKPLFNMELKVSEDNAEAFVLSLHPTLPGSPFSDDLARKVCLEEHHRHLLTPGQTSYNVTEEYEAFMKCVGTGNGLQARLVRMKDAVVRLGLMRHLTKSEELLSQTLTKTENFLKQLSEKQKQLHVPNLIKKLANRNYDSPGKTVADFDTNTIDWVTLLNKFLDEDKSQVSLKKIMVFEDNSISHILDVLSDDEYGPAELNNILLLLWVEKVYTDFVEPVGANVGDPEYCLNTAIALMEEVASYLYLQAVDKTTARDQQIDKIAENIKWEGLRVLENITTDEAATIALKEKLTNMMDEKDLVIKLSEVEDDVVIESTSDVRLSEDFLQNSLLLLEKRSVLMGDKLQDVTDSMWRVFAHPYDPFGFYDYKLDKIMIPYAAQEPFQAFQGVPDYLHYARIGYQIGHMMWHGYDTSGIAHPGAIRPSMESHLNAFKAKYIGPRNYTNPKDLTAEYNTTDLTANEIWADWKATGLAWQAYVNRNKMKPTSAGPLVVKVKDGPPTRRRRSADQPQDSKQLVLPYLDMTPDQLYFLHWAQQFCTDTSDLRMLEVMESRQPPGRERVNFVTRHTPEFQEAFMCPPQEN